MRRLCWVDVTPGPNPDIELGSDVDTDADDLQSQFGCCLDLDSGLHLGLSSVFFSMKCLKQQ